MVFCIDWKLFIVCILVEIVIIIVVFSYILTELLLYYIFFIKSFDRLFNTKFVDQSRTRKHTKWLIHDTLHGSFLKKKKKTGCLRSVVIYAPFARRNPKESQDSAGCGKTEISFVLLRHFSFLPVSCRSPLRPLLRRRIPFTLKCNKTRNSVYHCTCALPRKKEWRVSDSLCSRLKIEKKIYRWIAFCKSSDGQVTDRLVATAQHGEYFLKKNSNISMRDSFDFLQQRRTWTRFVFVTSPLIIHIILHWSRSSRWCRLNASLTRCFKAKQR